MYKSVIVVALCMFVFAECRPSEEKEVDRVARQLPAPVATGLGVAVQVASAAAAAAKKAVDVGKQAAQGVVQGAVSGVQMIPGLG